MKRGGDAQRFWQEQGLQTTTKLKVYLGMNESVNFAQAWAHRMQFLYDCHCAGLLVDPTTRADTLKSYVPMVELLELMEHGNDACKREGDRISSILDA